MNENWCDKISACFGTVDGIFAGHPCDGQSALELLMVCYKENVRLQDVIEKSEQYLRNNYGKDLTDTTHFEKHIAKQIEKIKAKFSPWLE